MDGTLTKPYLDFVALRQRLGIEDEDLIAYINSASGSERTRAEQVLEELERDGVANATLNRGVRTVMRYLARHAIPVALLTRNSRRSVEAVCGKLALSFDIIITRDDAPSKPSPEPVWQIGRHWHAPPGQLLVVGDFKWDMVCAHNAGAKSVVLVTRGATPDWIRGADFVIHRLTELTDIIDGKAGT